MGSLFICDSVKAFAERAQASGRGGIVRSAGARHSLPRSRARRFSGKTLHGWRRLKGIGCGEVNRLSSPSAGIHAGRLS
jgi:hypothetical protein